MKKNASHSTKPDRNTLLDGLQIPPQPEIVRALLGERESDDPDPRRIAGLIGRDAGITAALLKTVNSPYVGLRKKVSSIELAVAVLGMKQVTSLALSLALRAAIPTKGIEQYWECAGRTAQLATMLIRHLNLQQGDEAHLFALFQDCAVPLLLQRYPSYPSTLALSSNLPWSEIVALEDLNHTTNHAVVGGMLAGVWDLPARVRSAITHHHDPEVFQRNDVSEDVLTLISIGYLAKKVAETLKRQLNDCDCVLDAFGIACLAHLLLSPDELRDFIDTAREQFLPDEH
jgi:HD-like signal output (HDOD) protein